MAAPYYTHSSQQPANQTRALAAVVRDEFDLIAQSFDLLPLPGEIISGTQSYAVDSGITNALVASVSPSVAAYSDGLTLRVKAMNANTGPATINVNGLGIRSIVRPDGTSLAANDFYPGQIIQISYNATTSQFQLALTPLAAVYQALGFANAASASAGAAAASASSAAGSASSAGSSAALAQQWAISLSLVDGTYFGARYYAIAASGSASSASTSATNANAAAIAAAASAMLAAQTFNGTSSTSITVSPGTINFTTQTGKAWVSGQRVTVSRTSDPSIVMYGYVLSYDFSTGAMSVVVDKTVGSGTYTDWTIGLSGSNGLAATLSITPVTANTTASGGNYYVFTGPFILTMPTGNSPGVVIGFGVTQSQTGGIVRFGSKPLKGRVVNGGDLVLTGENNAAVVQDSGNSTYGWVEI